MEVARQLGWNVVRVRTHELSNIHFRINNPDRCYHCKTELFSELRQVAEDRGIRWIADGSRSEEHTSELQSHSDLVCRLLLEKKKTKKTTIQRIEYKGRREG